MHTLSKVPETEIRERIARFQSMLQEKETDGALITQNIDLYYLTGTMQNGVLYVPQKGEPCFYVKKSVTRAEFETVLPVQPLGRLRELGGKIESAFGPVKRLGLEWDVLPYGLAQRYIRLFSGAEPGGHLL